MEQICEYTFEIMTTDGIMSYQFTGDISTSSFVSNFVKDMEVEDGCISLSLIGDRNMSARDTNIFYSIWQYLSGTPAGIEFAKNISPDYFDDKGCEPAEFLPEELNTILNPVDQDIISHKEWLVTASNVTPDNMETNEITIQLLKFQPFITLSNLINYANFLGIEPMIQLFSKLIAEYAKLFIKIRRI